MTKPKGEVYMAGRKIELRFDSRLKGLKKHFVLYSILGGSFNPEYKTKPCSLQYSVDAKTLVAFNGEVEKISKVLSLSSVKSVWGKDMQGSQIVPKLASTGQPLDTYWSPNKDSVEVCRVFVEAANVMAIFNMIVKDGVLTPCGVTFVLQEAVKQTTLSKVFTLGSP